jgi:hypothetical protein
MASGLVAAASCSESKRPPLERGAGLFLAIRDDPYLRCSFSYSACRWLTRGETPTPALTSAGLRMHVSLPDSARRGSGTFRRCPSIESRRQGRPASREYRPGIPARQNLSKRHAGSSLARSPAELDTSVPAALATGSLFPARAIYAICERFESSNLPDRKLGSLYLRYYQPKCRGRRWC